MARGRRTCAGRANCASSRTGAPKCRRSGLARFVLLRLDMSERHVLIIGGGLSGLSTGCYARASGFRTTIVEHSLALGGVCTAWSRGPYTIDGCIQWLTGGAFDRIYDELAILPRV